MLFNSYPFIFLFFPISVIGYYLLSVKQQRNLITYFFIAISFLFYSYFKLDYVLILASSILFNYYAGKMLQAKRNRLILSLSIGFNILILCYFKYSNFFLETFDNLLQYSYFPLHILLPLGISFYTFQQISFLADCYRGDIKPFRFNEYTVFVSFFPQLIAGPIVRFNEMVPQFREKLLCGLDYENMSKGLFLFSIGLFKKEIIADTLGLYVNRAFDESLALSFLEAWAASLMYTFQLYFDFSGYTDMALGIALMFNICLPQNFDSPYKSTSIREFWRRWHMTLGRFIRDCMYFPMGGSKNGEIRTSFNLMFVFLLVGLWHGAGWFFIAWGGLHGIAMIIQRLWKQTKIQFPSLISWGLTFGFINMAWVFFRVTTLYDLKKMLSAMSGSTLVMFPDDFAAFQEEPWTVWGLLCISASLVFLCKNSNFIANHSKFNLKTAALTLALLLSAFLNLHDEQTFLYFNF